MITSRTTFADPRFLEVAPVYRVNFWERGTGGTWCLDAFLLTGASSVVEVLNWVERRQDGRQVEVFVEIDPDPTISAGRQRKSGLVRILGTEPDEGITVALGAFVASDGSENTVTAEA